MATTAPTAPTVHAAPADATNDASQANGRINSLFGTSADWRDALPTEVVQHVRSLSNEELFPLGEAALRDIADNLVILAEIRDRFYHAKGSLMGYANWKEFVANNSAYSIRTIQRRLNEATGTKDETKVNDRYKAPAIEVSHTISEPVEVPEPAELNIAPQADARQAWNALSPDEQAQWGIRNSDKSDGTHDTWDIEPYTHYRLENWEKRKNRDVPMDAPDEPATPLTKKDILEDLRKRYSEPDFYSRVGRAIHNLYKHNELNERLHELKQITRSDWCPVAQEGFNQVLQNLDKIQEQTEEYRKALRAVLKANRTK